MSKASIQRFATISRYLDAIPVLLRLVLIAVFSELMSCVPALPQSVETQNVAKTEILGTVVDANGDPIPNAAVRLEPAEGDYLATKTTDDGSFAIQNLAAGIVYQISVTAAGFTSWTSQVTIDSGQPKNMGPIRLQVLAIQRAITVNYSAREVAEQQLKAEEHQRVLGFIPNIYVTYEPHPEPLTAKMKFHLAYKGLTHPTFFAFQALWSGVEQAGGFPDYSGGAKGYGERYGAGLASGASEQLFGDAILPSLLHQDPRYFYRGSGTKRSRAWHAILAPFVCEGDNGEPQPNYSQWGGSLISASLSNAYYPASDRGAGLVFENFGVSMGLHVTLGLAQEFVLGRFTSKRAH
jgi:hypothetical protein